MSLTKPSFSHGLEQPLFKQVTVQSLDATQSEIEFSNSFNITSLLDSLNLPRNVKEIRIRLSVI